MNYICIKTQYWVLKSSLTYWAIFSREYVWIYIFTRPMLDVWYKFKCLLELLKINIFYKPIPTRHPVNIMFTRLKIEAH